jgi:hypothetical protein
LEACVTNHAISAHEKVFPLLCSALARHQRWAAEYFGVGEEFEALCAEADAEAIRLELSFEPDSRLRLAQPSAMTKRRSPGGQC